MVKSVPFKRFVQTYLFCGEKLPSIIEKLSGFEFNSTETDLFPLLEEIKAPLPEALAKKMNDCMPFNPYTSEQEKQWLEQIGLFEFFDFVIRRKQPLTEIPPYFKWFNDCLWILAYKEITCIVNIFLFNNESLDSISDIIMCKYKKKIGIEALERYKTIFWDTSAINAKDALYFYRGFRDNTLIVRIKSGHDTEIEHWDSVANDGSDTPIAFHDSNYIKWKIGYKKLNIPTADGFLDQVMQDSYFKYYEAMNMIRSMEEETEEGMNDKIGMFHSTKKIRKNVEEQKAKAAKAWLEMFIRTNRGKVTKPTGEGADDVFNRMSKIPMEFDTEKLMSIDDNPQIIEDIRKDI
jgi:hypothetical protein